MSIIINPNAPPPRKPDGLEMILNTMRIIAAYRKSFFDLEALKQNDGVSEPLTAAQLERACNAQQRLMQDMVDFILYGADKHDGIKPSQDSRPPAANIENNPQGVAKKESADWRTLLTENDQ